MEKLTVVTKEILLLQMDDLTILNKKSVIFAAFPCYRVIKNGKEAVCNVCLAALHLQMRHTDMCICTKWFCKTF